MSMVRRLTLSAAVVLVLPVSVDARTWTDITGRIMTEAEFVDFLGATVRVRRKGGTIMAISLDKLSKADQEFAKSQGRAEAKAEAQMAKPPVPAPGNGGLVTYDGRALPGRVVGFDVGRLKMSRYRGKHYVGGIEYDKLPKDQKYLIDAVLRDNNIPGVKAGIRVWGRRPYTFSYRIVVIQDGNEVFRLGLQQLSKKNADALLPAFTAWYVQQEMRVAAAEAEAGKAALAAQDKRDLERLRAKERKEREEQWSPRSPDCPICGLPSDSDPRYDALYGEWYQCVAGHRFVLPKKSP